MTPEYAGEFIKGFICGVVVVCLVWGLFID
jgi:hypothetical protein